MSAPLAAPAAGVAGLHFRPMQEADLPWVAARDAELYPFPWSQGNFADSMAAGYACWVMLDGAEPVGYGVLMMVIDEAHILNISVVASRQRGGLGRRLLGHFADVARTNGARRLLLEVRPSNGPALALYERAGFQTIGRRKGYYPAVGGREDGLVMSLAL
ncbi:ribosomal protein S18-alanine N-acetyltransferase [Zoogloea sp.]|mgnify:FL=1|uniref:ribosomal protein S18-alanine N-acetyltransferase n=1 Tax=Zoogloea sp. TaxID=49181 RepID=UPI0035B41BFF